MPKAVANWRQERREFEYARLFKDEAGKLRPEAAGFLLDLVTVSRLAHGRMIVNPQTRTVDPLATMYQNGQADLVGRVFAMLGLAVWQIEEITRYDDSIKREREQRTAAGLGRTHAGDSGTDPGDDTGTE